MVVEAASQAEKWPWPGGDLGHLRNWKTVRLEGKVHGTVASFRVRS